MTCPPRLLFRTVAVDRLAFVVPVAPVGVNHAYKPARWGKRQGMVLTDEGGQFKTAVAFHAKRALFGTKLNREADAYAVAVRYFFKTLQSDVDGPTKLVLDALADAGVYPNDNRVRYVELHKRKDPKSPRVEIEVWSLDPEVP